MSDNTKPNSPKQQKEKRPPYHEAFAEKIIERLEEGTAPWQIPWTPGQATLAPHNPASGTVYRGMNRVHLALSGYDDPRWMTLKQANDNGYSILPGSKATPVVYFQFTDEKNKLDNDGKPVLDADGKPEKEKVELDKPIVRFAHVFNAEQVGGIPPLQLTDKAYEWEPIEKAENILAASGAAIKHDQSNRAFYRRMEDAIHLPPKEIFDAPDKYYATALHELGHWTGEENRLNREFGPFGSEKYAREELRAEIASWMLGQEIGIGHDSGQHAAYVQSWIQVLKEDPYEIVRACRDAEKIKEYVIDLERKKELRQEGQEQVVQPEKANQRGKSLEKEEGIAAMGVPAALATEKTFLAVPYKEKERAKKFGAKWDKENKLWYAPEGTDLTPLAPWIPEKVPAPEPSMPPQEEFANALEQAGLDLRGKAPVMDGQIHRVPLIGRNGGDLDGAYCGYLDERPAGWMQNFSAGEKHTWVATGHTLTKEQLEAQRAEIARKREERQRLILEQQQKTAREAHTEWIAHDWASADNPYLQAKGVQPFGVREDVDGTLLVLDRFCGYMVSGPLSNASGEKLSAGRVQSPAVRLVVDREKEIKVFSSTTHYGAELTFENVDNITDGWKAALLVKPWLQEDQEYLLDKFVAEKAAALRTLDVLDCKESESRTAPPAPFTTSTLQQAASSSVKFTPKQTMQLAQRLYEQGAITYMRTDSPNLSHEAVHAIRAYCEAKGWPLVETPRKWKSKEGAQEAHEAVRPTHIEIEEAGETADEKALYRLIRLRSLACQLEDAVYAVRTLQLGADVDGKQALFEAKGRTLLSQGWKILADQKDGPCSEGEESEEEPLNPVPVMKPGTKATALTGTVTTKKTKPAARFTEASLIRELEKRGIGRPSTYAAIIDTISSRKYVTTEKRFLVPTPLGEKIVSGLCGHFSFIEYDFTRTMEQSLDDIAEGKADYRAVIASAHDQLSREVQEFAKATGRVCEKCGKPMVHRVKKPGKDGKGGYDFWGCTGWPECDGKS